MSASTRIIWILASLLFVVVFAIRDPTSAWTFTTIDRSSRNAWLEGAIVSAFGALCLWQQLRRLFLTGRSQAPTFGAIWALFGLGYPAIGGLIMLATGNVHLAGSDPIDWRLTAQSFAAGQLASLSAMAVSLVWNGDEPGVSSVRLHREVVLGVLTRTYGQRTIAPSAKTQLDAALAHLDAEARTLSAKLLNQTDVATLAHWQHAAAALQTIVAGRPASEWGGLPWAEIRTHLDAMRSSP